MKTRCPRPRATIAGATTRARAIGARRLTSSIPSISSWVSAASMPVAGCAALATSTSTSASSAAAARRSTSAATARSHTVGPGAEFLGQPRELGLAAPAEQQPDSARPERAGDRGADAAGGAGEQRRAAGELKASASRHGGQSRRRAARRPARPGSAPAPGRRPGQPGNTASVAVNPCRKLRPPTGPISPAAKNPAAGTPPSSLWTSAGVVVARAEHPLPTPVAGEDQRARRPLTADRRGP